MPVNNFSGDIIINQKYSCQLGIITQKYSGHKGIIDRNSYIQKELLALLIGTVPVNKELLTGTVPINKESTFHRWGCCW